MSLNGYKDFLDQENIPQEKINKALTIIEQFKSFLYEIGSDLTKITYDNVHDFSAKLIQEKNNTYQNFVYILYFGYYLNNHDITNAIMETIFNYFAQFSPQQILQLKINQNITII